MGEAGDWLRSAEAKAGQIRSQDEGEVWMMHEKDGQPPKDQ